MKIHGFLILAAFFSVFASADDKVTTLYDRTVDDVRVGVFEGQMQCIPGKAGGFATNSRLILDSYWIRVSHPEFAALSIEGKVTYDDPILADRCAELRKAFAGQDTYIGKARRTATEHYGIRFGVCWHWMQESVTLDVNGFHFDGGYRGMTIGPAAEDKCRT